MHGRANQSLRIINFNHMNKLVYSFYGAIATILVVVTAFASIYGSGHGETKNDLVVNSKVANAPKPKFSKLSQLAFGPLGGISSAGVSTPMGMGGGTGVADSGAISTKARQAAEVSSPASGGVDGKMIMPPFEGKAYKFVYKGQELKLENAQLDVVKRVKGTEIGVDAKNLISNLNLSFVDLNTFPDQKIQNLNFIQKGDFGYITSLSLDEGIVSIYQNWETWPSGRCGSDSKCYESLRVNLGDMPTDEELIAIANQFISEHAIDRSGYGDPEVNTDWRRQYEAVSDKSTYYFPDGVEVVYPLKIDGKFVYDEYNAAKTGLSVYVQVKDRKVNNVNNLTTQVYNTSAYDMETDAQKIIAYAEKGGSGGVMYWGENKIEDLELSDPEMVYVRQYVYRDNQNYELYVPAMYFPIKNLPKDPNFNRKAVIIPLAKDILDERLNSDNGGGFPGVMPMETRSMR